MFTVVTERVFSVIKFIKTKLRNKIKDKFFANSLIVYIKRKITESLNLNLKLDDFISLK
jgi:hypothetical protein